MKKLLFLILLFTSIISLGQENVVNKDGDKIKDITTESSTSEIDMDIDETIYTIKRENAYLTKDQNTGIIASVVPTSFEKIKKNFNKWAKKKWAKTISKGELTIDGVKLLFLKQSFKREGIIYYMIIYSKEKDKDSSFKITSFFEKNKEKFYKPLIEKAVVSAKSKI